MLAAKCECHGCKPGAGMGEPPPLCRTGLLPGGSGELQFLLLVSRVPSVSPVADTHRTTTVHLSTVASIQTQHVTNFPLLKTPVTCADIQGLLLIGKA